MSTSSAVARTGYGKGDRAVARAAFAEEVVAALEPEFQKLVYGDKADKGKKSRQTLLLGKPELDWLAREAERLAAQLADAAAAKKAVAEWAKDKNYKAMSENSRPARRPRRRLVRPHGHLRSRRQYRGAGACRPCLHRPW